MKRLFSAAVTGATMALLPLLALAAEPPKAAAPVVEGRGVPMPGDLSLVVWLTIAALTVLFVVLVLGYLYRRERGLDWAFQAPAVPHDDHHDTHAAPAAAAPAAAAHGGGHH